MAKKFAARSIILQRIEANEFLHNNSTIVSYTTYIAPIIRSWFMLYMYTFCFILKLSHREIPLVVE